MAELIGGGRPVTTCARCYVSDDHPKDVRTDPLDETKNIRHHLQCIREVDPVVGAQLADLDPAARGQEVLDHLLERVADGRAESDGGVHPPPEDSADADEPADDIAGESGPTTER